MIVKKKINILGTEYTVEESDETQDIKLEGKDGYCDTSVKKCVVERFLDKSVHNVEDIEMKKRMILRHELMHAIFYESGLDNQSFAGDETLVDWFAIQFPKIAKIFLECGCAG